MGIQHLEKLLSDPSCKIVPVVNQIELHPANPSPKLLHTAPPRASTARPILHSAALTQNCTPTRQFSPSQNQKAARRSSSFCNGALATVQASFLNVTKERIESNFDLSGFELNGDKFATVSAISSRFKVCGDSWLSERVFFGDDE